MYANIKKINQKRNTGFDRETQRQISFFKKSLKDHEAKKPADFDINETDDQKRYDAMMEIQRWATSYGILIRKLHELGYDFTKDKNWVRQQAAAEGAKAEQELKSTGTVSIGDMQIVSNPKQSTDDVQPVKGRVRVSSKSKDISSGGEVSKRKVVKKPKKDE